MNYSALAVLTLTVVLLLIPPLPAASDPATAVVRWCGSGNTTDDPLLQTATRACGDWGRHLVQIDPEAMDIAYLWVLKTLLARYPEPELDAFIASFESRFQEGRGPIVFPNAPKRWLPKDPGEGLDRFRNFVSAVSGRPATRALRFLDEFTRTPGEAYVLTHQYVALVKADETGLELPAEVRDRMPGLLRRMRAEHQVDPSPGDLDFERSLFLLLYADPEYAEAKRWIERMLGAWDASNKRWTFERIAELRYDGHVRRFRYGPDHPTVLALGAVREFLGRARTDGTHGAFR